VGSEISYVVKGLIEQPVLLVCENLTFYWRVGNTSKSVPKIDMSAVFGSLGIVVINRDVLSSVTSAGMETTAIANLSILILKSISESFREPLHDDCLDCMAWSSISDLVLEALSSCRVPGEHIRWVEGDISVGDRHDLFRSARFSCGSSLKEGEQELLK
jgi:hypothetical protein